jgi:myo-inositol-1(or 4)-monophosphatase
LSDLVEVLNFSKKLVLEVSEKLLWYQSRLSSLTITTKEAQGVASEADMVAEEMLVEALTKKYPHHTFLAEEQSYQKFGTISEYGDEFKKAPWLWVIDPLDGTNNFLNGLDYFCISMSLCHLGRPVLGLIYRPSTGEMFSAIEGQKSLYQKNAKTSAQEIFQDQTTKQLKDCLLATGFVSEKGEYFDREFAIFKEMMKHSRGLRRMGSAALDLSYVALGIFDGFWERGLAPWDVAAAGFICQQAGVQVTDYNGQAFSPFAKTIVAARAPIAQNLRDLL